MDVEQAPLTLGEALQATFEAYDADVLQHNELLDEVDDLRAAFETHTAQIAALTLERDQLLKTHELDLVAIKETEKQVLDVTAGHARQMIANKQNDKEKIQAMERFVDQNILVKNYKDIGTPKQIRDKIKKYQETAKEHVSASNLYKQTIKDLRREVLKVGKERDFKEDRLIEIDMTSVYSKEGDHLWLFPKMMEITNRGATRAEIVMLYLNNNGNGGLISINEFDELMRPVAEKNWEPRQETLARCAVFLRRAKHNGWTLRNEDLRAIGLESDQKD